MLITKRSDYAIRICRAIKDCKTHNIREICELEDIPKAFAYKIIREMEQNGIVKSERGNKGGYYLVKDLKDLTLHDIVKITEEDVAILHCMKEKCDRNKKSEPCRVHNEIERIQNVLEEELKRKTIAEVIGDCGSVKEVL